MEFSFHEKKEIYQSVTQMIFVRRGLLVNCRVAIFRTENEQITIFLCQSLIVH